MAEINKSPAFWRSFPIFEEFSKELVAEVAGLAQWRKWPSGTVIFQRGDDGNYMILVTEGRIKLSLITTQGKELSLRHLEPGTLLGEMAVLDGEPRSADATATVATEGYLIGKAEFGVRRAFFAQERAHGHVHGAGEIAQPRAVRRRFQIFDDDGLFAALPDHGERVAGKRRRNPVEPRQPRLQPRGGAVVCQPVVKVCKGHEPTALSDRECGRAHPKSC